jgi:putative transposase
MPVKIVDMMEEKKIKGRKRHIVVDILGNLLHVKVHAANIHDTKASCAVFNETVKKYPSIEAFSGDASYCGTAVGYVDNEMKLKLHISKKIKDEFAVLPKRWIVERTFAWIGNFRRLAKDFEILTERAENFVRIAMIKVTLERLPMFNQTLSQTNKHPK